MLFQIYTHLTQMLNWMMNYDNCISCLIWTVVCSSEIEGGGRARRHDLPSRVSGYHVCSLSFKWKEWTNIRKQHGEPLQEKVPPRWSFMHRNTSGDLSPGLPAGFLPRPSETLRWHHRPQHPVCVRGKPLPLRHCASLGEAWTLKVVCVFSDDPVLNVLNLVLYNLDYFLDNRKKVRIDSI